jgi:hypothetical protein
VSGTPRVTLATLRRLGTLQAAHYLYCRKCHSEWSADARDYFWAEPGHVFKCCRTLCSLEGRAPLTPMQEPVKKARKSR